MLPLTAKNNERAGALRLQRCTDALHLYRRRTVLLSSVATDPPAASPACTLQNKPRCAHLPLNKQRQHLYQTRGDAAWRVKLWRERTKGSVRACQLAKPQRVFATTRRFCRLATSSLPRIRACNAITACDAARHAHEGEKDFAGVTAPLPRLPAQLATGGRWRRCADVCKMKRKTSAAGSTVGHCAARQALLARAGRTHTCAVARVERAPRSPSGSSFAAMLDSDAL